MEKIEEEGGWQTVSSSSSQQTKQKKTTSTPKSTSNNSGSNHRIASGEWRSKSENQTKKASTSVSTKKSEVEVVKKVASAGKSAAGKPSTANSSGIASAATSSTTGGRKLSQSNKKQGFALFDVLLNKSKPEAPKTDKKAPSDASLSTATSTNNKSATAEVKKEESKSTVKQAEPTPAAPVSKLSVYKPPAPPIAVTTTLSNAPSGTVKATALIEPKKPMPTKDKKKAPSTLKKRILTERLRQHLIQEEKTKELQVLEEIKSSSSTAYQDRTVVIANFIGNDEDVASMEDDERQELIDNIQELLSPCGTIFSVEITSLETHTTTANENTESNNETEIFKYAILVTFVHSFSALRAVDVLQGLVVAGQKMHLQLYSKVIQYSANKTSTVSDVAQKEDSAVEVQQEKKKGKGDKKKPSQQESSSTASILLLSNIITSPEEVEDKDEVMEVLNDIYHLASSSITFQQDIANIWIEESTLSTRKHAFLQPLLDPLSPWLPLTIIQTDSCVHAGTLIEALHSKVIGGEILEAGYVWSALGSDSNHHPKYLHKEDHHHMTRLGILFQDMIEEEVTEDEDEVAEILSNMETLLQSQAAFASLSTYDAHRCIRGDRDVIWYMDIIEGIENISELLEDVSMMSEELAKVNVGGSYLQVRLLMSTSEEPTQWWTPLLFEDCFLVGVRHYLTTDDLDDIMSASVGNNNESHEQIMTFKSDLLTLIERSETSEVVASVRSIDFLYSAFFSSSAELHVKEEEEGKTYDVAILFSNYKIAQQAMFYLDQLILGGNAIDAWIRKYDHSDDDQNQVNLRIIQERQMDASSTTTASNTTISSEMLNMDITKYHSIYKVHNNDPNPRSSSITSTSTSANTSVTLPQEKKYQIAKSAPKLLRHGPNTLLFESSIPVANEEINVVIKEFLRLISTFQLRLKEKLPANKVKQKLRYVTGMKQTLNSIKACKAKLLIIAPNTEQSDELDAMLSNVIYEAAQREVPTIYGLNKRQLGKALQMSMKQSVVVIFDPDGAYEYYKKIVRFVTANTKPLPKDAVNVTK